MNKKSETRPGKHPDPPAPAAPPTGEKAKAPKSAEPEPIHCASPPCMMGELDEILEE